jgi:IclR family transcriptional regulator, acetate operon repressor
MRTNLEFDQRTSGIAPAGQRRKGADVNPHHPLKSIKEREHKLGVTARSFAVLEHVAGSRAPVDVLDIIASLKLPKATAYRLVDWFVTQGYLSREPARRRLIIGPKLTNLAFDALSSSMRYDTPHVVLQRLVHTLNETCNIGTLLNGEVVYLDRVEAEHWPLRLHYTVGSRVPLHCSAIGKLFLALAAAPRRRRLLQSLELRRFTDSTITDSARLETELRQIRKEQASFDREEYLVGVVCMAVPVIGKNGEMLAALAIQAPQARMNVQTARRHLPALLHAAAELAEIFQDRSLSQSRIE